MGALAEQLEAMRKNGVLRMKLHPNGEIAEVEFSGAPPSLEHEPSMGIGPRPPTDVPQARRPDPIRDVLLADLPALEATAEDYPAPVVEETEDAHADAGE
jgi:hypothetical protein